MNERDFELRETDREYLTRAFLESFQQDIDLASVSLNRGNRWKFGAQKACVRGKWLQDEYIANEIELYKTN